MGEGWVWTFHSASPKVGDNHKLLALERREVRAFARHRGSDLYRRIEMADARFRFFAHPSSIKSHVFCQPISTRQKSGCPAYFRSGFGIYWGPSCEPRRELDHGLV